MKQYKLLIVENDDDERFFMRQEFEEFGAFDVLGEFENGDTLFEWLAENPSEMPDFILSDLNMPGKNGYDILSQIKSNPTFANVKVIITSTSPVVSIREKCLAMGASDYLIKPEIFVDYGQYVKELFRKIDI